MKKIIMPLLMILTATLFIAAMPTEAECAIYEDTVRLHILASSDSEEDQRIKLRLRDEILKEFGEELSVFESTADAKARLAKRLDEIEHFSNEQLKKLGSDKQCSVTLSEEWYDTREYESFTLPQGYYTSLRIIIGEGEGQNWWCVMFPPLCLDAATSGQSYSKSEELLITKKYNIKFKILELVSDFMR